MRQVTTKLRKFLYLRDPLFLTSLFLYFLNRWVFKTIWASGFVHAHLNDLICIPFWVPIMLAGQRRAKLRPDDSPPHASEIVIPLFVWSWVFEILLPAVDPRREPMVSDHEDIVYYTLGALIAGVFWRVWYQGGGTAETNNQAGQDSIAT